MLPETLDKSIYTQNTAPIWGDDTGLAEAFDRFANIKNGGKQKIIQELIESALNENVDLNRIIAVIQAATSDDPAYSENIRAIQEYLNKHPGYMTPEMEDDLKAGIRRDFPLSGIFG